MTVSRRLFSSLAAAIVAAVVTASGLAYVVVRVRAAEARLIAFPASSPEADIIGALAAAGMNAVGATNALVPLSDFSRVVEVPYLNAAERTGGGDPRRTPLLDALEARFTVPGPNGEPWSVIYLPEPTWKRDEAAARVLSGLGGDWAWDAPGRRGNPRFLWFPALAWGIWIVVRKPRRGRLGRALVVFAWLPLLAYRAPASAAMFVALGSAAVVADRCIRSGAKRRLARVLWPYAIAVLALAAFAPGTVPLLAASLILAAAALYARPRLERLVGRNRLHDPPAFRALTMAGALDYARKVSRGTVFPLAAILVLAAFSPAGDEPAPAGGSAFRIERGTRSLVDDPTELLEEHLAFQAALTFGRIGTLQWGDLSYAPAYRYSEEGGRMKRVDDSGETGQPMPAGTFSAAALALAGGDPSPVTSLGDVRPYR